MTWAPIYILLYLWAFWYLYVLIMGFYRAHLDKRLTRTAFCLAIPALIAGYVVDLLANWTIATLVFREFPQRPLELVTDRLTRYLGNLECSNHGLAKWICDELLDYFDRSGKHCNPTNQG